MFTIREVPCKIAQFISRHGVNPPRRMKDIATDFLLLTVLKSKPAQ